MKRARFRLLLAACAVLLAGAMWLRLDVPVVRAADFSVSANVIACSELPEFGPYYASPLCDPADGIGLTFADENGAALDSCATSGGACAIDRPFSSTTVVELDESTIPAGYYLYSDNPQTFLAPDGPPDGVVGFPLFVLLPVDAPAETYGVTGAVAFCAADPYAQGNSWLDLCEAAAGAELSFANDQDGSITTCTTAAGIIEGGGEAGICTVQEPLGSTTTVTLESWTDDAYVLLSDNPQFAELPSTPPDGILSFPVFVLVPLGGQPDADIPDNGGSQAPELTGDDGRAVVLYAGDCDNLGSPVVELNNVVPEVGEPVGDSNALTAAMSVTIGAPVFLDEAIDGGYALVVFTDATAQTPAACGELGGVNNHDGVLPIGLAPAEPDGLSGVATFSYNATDETTTDVTVIVTEISTT